MVSMTGKVSMVRTTGLQLSVACKGETRLWILARHFLLSTKMSEFVNGIPIMEPFRFKGGKVYED
jgi:hypothetical protein